MPSRLSLLLNLFLLASCPVSAQDDGNKIEGDFKGLSAIQFFNKLEKLGPYKFYYDANQLDSFIVQVTAKGEALTDLLNKAFKDTDLHFSIDDDKNVFITRKLQIVTDLPKGFFGNTANLANNTSSPSDSILDQDIQSKNA